MFQLSLCDEPMTELTNPGAGGSIFYITADDEFIIKTAQHKEANFLQKLLPGYYMVGTYFKHCSEHVACERSSKMIFYVLWGVIVVFVITIDEQLQ